MAPATASAVDFYTTWVAPTVLVTTMGMKYSMGRATVVRVIVQMMLSIVKLLMQLSAPQQQVLLIGWSSLHAVEPDRVANRHMRAGSSPRGSAAVVLPLNNGFHSIPSLVSLKALTVVGSKMIHLREATATIVGTASAPMRGL